MFLCRGGRRASAGSPFSYYKLAASVQVPTNKPRDAIRALHNYPIISCSQLCNPATSRVSVSGLDCGMFQDKCVKSPQYKSTWTACRSLSGLGFLLPFSCSSGNRLNPRGSFLYPAAEPGIIHSSTKLLSSALSRDSSQKPQGAWRDREPATEVQKMHFSQIHQGGDEKPEPEEKQNKTQQLKKVFKEYGAVGILFHVGISIISLGIFYTAVSSGINITTVLCKLGFSESVVQSKMAAGTSTFVIAYAVHKLFAPFRISITLVSVPFIVRYLRKTGLFKSSPPHL